MKQSAIEKGDPIPEIEPRNNKYSFHKMKVGEHFTMEEFTPDDVQRVRVAACNYGRRNDKKFITRTVLDKKLGELLKVWREA
tara:strand:+ start:31568 stop:31813 length:246 start_codon:yes stop_codon:yes gene_type:complete